MMTNPFNPDDAGGVLTFEQLLAMTREQADAAGHRGAWNYAHLSQLINQALEATPEPGAMPPSYFISYRWESDAHKAWVASFAEELAARGYDVVLDQRLQEDHAGRVPVPELISRMAQCNHFLFVLTEAYLARIGAFDGPIRDGWVWDEYQVAMQLSERGRIKPFVCVWRSGALPDWISGEQALDFRDDAGYGAMLERAFPRRMANIIGVRADGSTRVVGPVERVDIERAGRELEASETFDRFLIEHL